MDLSREGFGHWPDDNGGGHNGFIDLFDFAVASPDVGTAGMRFRVSTSCYRRLFAALLVVLFLPGFKRCI